MKIVHNKLLGGWFIVRGAHDTPIAGRFNSKAEALAWLNRAPPRRGLKVVRLDDPAEVHNALKTILGE